MGKRSRTVAATPAAVPAEADSPASCAPTARKCSRFSDPALEDEADGLAPVGTAIEQPQDDKASDLPAVTSSFQDEAPAPSFESPALQIASTNDSTGNETAAAAADNESAPAADIPEASRAEPCRPLTAQALVERLKTLLIVVTPIGLDEVEPPGESPLLRDPTNDDLALATEAVETFLERHGHAMERCSGRKEKRMGLVRTAPPVAAPPESPPAGEKRSGEAVGAASPTTAPAGKKHKSFSSRFATQIRR